MPTQQPIYVAPPIQLFIAPPEVSAPVAVSINQPLEDVNGGLPELEQSVLAAINAILGGSATVANVGIVATDDGGTDGSTDFAFVVESSAGADTEAINELLADPDFAAQLGAALGDQTVVSSTTDSPAIVEPTHIGLSSTGGGEVSGVSAEDLEVALNLALIDITGQTQFAANVLSNPADRTSFVLEVVAPGGTVQADPTTGALVYTADNGNTINLPSIDQLLETAATNHGDSIVLATAEGPAPTGPTAAELIEAFEQQYADDDSVTVVLVPDDPDNPSSAVIQISGTDEAVSELFAAVEAAIQAEHPGATLGTTDPEAPTTATSDPVVIELDSPLEELSEDEIDAVKAAIVDSLDSNIDPVEVILIGQTAGTDGSTTQLAFTLVSSINDAELVNANIQQPEFAESFALGVADSAPGATIDNTGASPTQIFIAPPEVSAPATVTVDQPLDSVNTDLAELEQSVLEALNSLLTDGLAVTGVNIVAVGGSSTDDSTDFAFVVETGAGLPAEAVNVLLASPDFVSQLDAALGDQTTVSLTDPDTPTVIDPVHIDASSVAEDGEVTEIDAPELEDALNLALAGITGQGQDQLAVKVLSSPTDPTSFVLEVVAPGGTVQADPTTGALVYTADNGNTINLPSIDQLLETAATNHDDSLVLAMAEGPVPTGPTAAELIEAFEQQYADDNSVTVVLVPDDPDNPSSVVIQISGTDEDVSELFAAVEAAVQEEYPGATLGTTDPEAPTTHWLS